ncbi:hypothetical protein IM660_10380 [Ruania alkalisoli]|uniref:Uncharacterized protein n=1 Tax=Ruania alkalisoli TaxID=2779775 RepID=A0A7M1SNI4_9MICO|nr:hypothetical protein [Ruania alkalisoli]QOR69140.1 hypothetical protein IM660_10380 [Ruania alkalisoli]
MPDGDAVLHQLRYKYSPEENEQRSSEAGRLANTYDGENHWRERTYLRSSSALSYPDDPRMQLGVSCDHVLDYLLTAEEFQADLNAQHTEVRIRSDRTRYAV